MSVVGSWIDSLPGTPAEAPPTIVPAGGIFTGWVNVTLLPPDTNATLYYTLDGTLPTTNSLLYQGPFLLTNTALVSANAFETGFVNSVALKAQFMVLTNLVLSAPTFPGGGVVQMHFVAPTGFTYVLQGSTNLFNWVPVATNRLRSSPVSFRDPAAANTGMRFYRARVQ